MNLFEAAHLAVTSLKANKVRSLLTMLGIIIGISSVIGIMTVGNAMSKSVSDSLSSLGSHNVWYYVVPRSNDYTSVPGEQDVITDEMLDAVQSRYDPAISGIGLSVAGGAGQARVGNRTANVSINGSNIDNFDVEAVELLAGRLLQERDIKSSRNVAIVSDLLVKKLYRTDPQKALGKELRVSSDANISTFTIIGVYKFKEDPMAAFGGMAQSEEEKTTTLYLPLTTAKEMTNRSTNGYNQVTLKLADDVDVAKTTDDINEAFNQFFKKNRSYKVEATSVESITQQTDAALSSVKIAIAVIAGISLLVGGIGVMNIMLVSVTERTQEIGIRKALGATNNNIRSQFIVESMIVCLIGGVIGVLLGSGLGYMGSIALKAPSFPSILSIVIAVTFSMTIGIFFGFYPANKAARLDPIDALRYE